MRWWKETHMWQGRVGPEARMRELYHHIRNIELGKCRLNWLKILKTNIYASKLMLWEIWRWRSPFILSVVLFWSWGWLTISWLDLPNLECDCSDFIYLCWSWPNLVCYCSDDIYIRILVNKKINIVVQTCHFLIIGFI